jgi:hypothetical protein
MRLCLLLLTIAAAPVSAVTVYVAPDGDDGNPGTQAKPFATVERARDALRAAPADGERIAQLAAGTYRLGRTLTFGPADSGTPEHPVVYRAAPGAAVVLSGGRVVRGWTVDAAGRWRATVDLSNFRQLWVDGQRAPRTRGPAPAGLKPWGRTSDTVEFSDQPRPAGTGVTAGYRAGTLKLSGDSGYTSSDAGLATWRNPGDMEFGYFNSWTHMIVKIDRLEAADGGSRIVMAQPGFFLNQHKGGTQIGAPAYLENAFELLNTPGQWYFDRPAKTLWYLPRPGQDPAKTEVVAPALETLLAVRGSLETPVHDLRFEGLTLSHATWLRPSSAEGHADVQANFTATVDNGFWRPEGGRSWSPVNGELLKSPANVQIDAGHGITFEACAFRALGGAGLDFDHGAQDNAVEGCRFEDISGSGVQIGAVTREDHHPGDPRRIVKGNRLSNCLITHIGVEYTDACGVLCGYTEGSVISHNEIAEIPYTGVSVGWGWGEPDGGGGAYVSPVIWTTPTASRANQIEFNHIHDLMRVRNDGGAVYTLGRQPGTVVRGNYIHDSGPGQPGGIYLDEGSAEIEVDDNVIAQPRPEPPGDLQGARQPSRPNADHRRSGGPGAQGRQRRLGHRPAAAAGPQPVDDRSLDPPDGLSRGRRRPPMGGLHRAQRMGRRQRLAVH